MNPSKIHLISGRTGAGKTTIAKQMESDFPAFRVSHDELLVSLYGDEIGAGEFQACCRKINDVVWRQVAQLSALEVDVVIEGWGTRSLRDQARKELDRLNVSYEFYFVDCPRNIRLERVRKRNQNTNGEGMEISDEEFERMERIKEEFDQDEEFILIDNTGSRNQLKEE
ncbi:MAG: AAA family ATPase [Akkermansiaceae bacterium]